MTSLHNQTPTCTMTEADYETALVHLGEQITAEMGPDASGFEGDNHKNAIDALANTFGTDEDQTILEWLIAAGKRVGIDGAKCVGV